MFELFGTRLLEAEDLAAFRIDSGHDMPDGSVFSGAIHSLKDQEQCVPTGGVVKILERSASPCVAAEAPYTALLICNKDRHSSATC